MPARLLETVQLRRMHRADIESGLRLCRAANWNQVAADWDLFLAASPGGCHVAVREDGTVIGSVATIRYGNAFSWISMVLVDPRHRRAGLGTRLLHAALATLDGVPSIRLDATPAGHAVYLPLGFHEEYHLQRMERAAGPSPITCDRVARPMTEADLERVLTQDRAAFGGDRRRVLEMLYREAPEYAWVTGRSGIDGYLFGRHGYMFEHLGPLVGHDVTSARRLVACCLARHTSQPFIIDAPLHSPWIDWLALQGFAVQRPFIRMCRGVPRFHERLDRMFAITGPEFG
jgi:GNAT superfamily N-acetyltransferase